MGMARGNSTTDGYHERRIPIPPRVVRLFGGVTDRLGTVSRAGTAGRNNRDKVLQARLVHVVQAAPAKINFDSGQAEFRRSPILRAFDREVDRTFFQRLFDELAETGDASSKANAG